MKTVRTRKFPIKNNRQEILTQAFRGDRERVKPFSEDDKGEDRRFDTSLPGFDYREESHEASRYMSKIATVTISSKGRITIPRELRTLMNIKPGQIVDVTEKDGIISIVPIRPTRGGLPELKPFVREKKDRFD